MMKDAIIYETIDELKSRLDELIGHKVIIGSHEFNNRKVILTSYEIDDHLIILYDLDNANKVRSGYKMNTFNYRAPYEYEITTADGNKERVNTFIAIESYSTIKVFNIPLGHFGVLNTTILTIL